MKRLIQTLGMMVSMLLSFLPASAYDFEVDGICYDIVSVTDLTCAVAESPNGYSGDIVIPETVTYNNRQLSVVSIREKAFRGCGSLTSIVLPESLTEIGSYAFSGCGSLTSIVLPESLTEIGYEAFENCSSLTSIVLPESLSKIGDYAFYQCSSLTSIVLPENFTEIGYKAFYQCSSLTSIVLPKNVTEIGSYLFCQCSSLTSIVLPESLTEIGSYAFSGCRSLTSIVLPESLTEIGSYAFSGCRSLMSIVIPENVTVIGSSAFSGCTSLERIKLSNELKKLNYGTFAECSSLSSLTIPGQITEIGLWYNTYGVISASSQLFGGCDELKEIVIEYGFEPLSAFYDESKTAEKTNLMFALEISHNSEISYNSGYKVQLPLPIQKATIDRELSNNIDLDSLRHYTIGEHVAANQVNLGKSKSLESITCFAMVPPTGVNNLSNLQYASVVVRVPNESLVDYKKAEGWKNFWNIEGFDVAGIDDASTEKAEEVYVVYNLQGVMVLKTEMKQDFHNLPAGIYIVNGRKTIIK